MESKPNFRYKDRKLYRLQFKCKEGMICKLYLSTCYEEEVTKVAEYTYGKIRRVDVLKKTYTVYEPDLKESVKYNMMKLHIDFIDEEINDNDIDKFLTTNDNGKKFYEVKLYGNKKVYKKKQYFAK